MPVNVFYKEIKFRLRKSKHIKCLLNAIASSNKMSVDQLNYVFVNKETILSVNKQFLNHDYYTDIITFDYTENNIISGEVYICFDVVKENAKIYNTLLFDEVLRVMIHGILHIVGFNDLNDEEKVTMREQENKWLSKFYDNEV